MKHLWKIFLGGTVNTVGGASWVVADYSDVIMYSCEDLPLALLNASLIIIFYTH